MTMKRVLVATAGGDCPGLNAVIRAIVKRASQERDWEILGSIQAFNGVLWEPTEVKILDEEAVAGIHFQEEQLLKRQIKVDLLRGLLKIKTVSGQPQIAQKR